MTVRRSAMMAEQLEHLRRQRGEHGYVLLTTLTAMMLCFIVITVMLNLTMSTAAIEEEGLKREREFRAAEGALDAALNQFRNSPAMATVYADECEPVSGPAEVEGLTVRVGCFSEGLSGSPKVPNDDGQLALRLLGDPYKANAGGVNDQGYFGLGLTDWATRDPGAGPAELSWSDALGAHYDQSELTTDPQLVHFGASPLTVIGGVEVKREIAGLRTDGGSPAVEVFGTAVQGGGPLHSGSPPSRALTSAETTEGIDPRCGVSEPNDQWGVAAADVVTSSFFSQGTSPVLCNDAVIAAGGAGTPDAPVWDNATVKAYTGFTHVASADEIKQNPDCGSLEIRNAAGVIRLEGAYDADATKILNHWWSPGVCAATTFWFGGDVWFDVFDPSKNPDDPKRNSLIFNDREHNWVFGDANGWNPSSEAAPMSGFPNSVCNRTAPPANPANGESQTRGANITLSSRTGLYHNAGRVVVCGPKQTGTDYHKTAISQRPATELGARFVPTGLAGNGDWTGSVGALQRIGSGSLRTEAEREWYEDLPIFGDTCWFSGTCVGADLRRSFTATGFGLPGAGTPDANPPDPGPQDITTAWIDLTADADWSNHNLAYTQFDVTLAAVPSASITARTCVAKFGPNTANRMPDNWATVSYDLMSSAGNVAGQNTCASQIDNRAQLRDASVTVTVQMNPFPLQSSLTSWICRIWPGRCPFPPSPSMSVSIDQIALRTEWSPGFPDTYPRTSANFPTSCSYCVEFTGDPLLAARADGQHAWLDAAASGSPAKLQSRLRYQLWDNTLRDGFLRLKDITFTPTIDKPSNIDQNNSTVKFQLVTNNGIICQKTVRFSAINDNVATPITFDPEDIVAPPVGPATPPDGCTRDGASSGGVDAGDIVSYDSNPEPSISTIHTAELWVELDMVRTSGTNIRVGVDAATVSASTTGYPRPLQPFRVRWNPLEVNPLYGTVPNGDAMFNVFGTVSVPNNAVEVAWAPTGIPSGYGIFNGGSLPDTATGDPNPGCVLDNRVFCRPGLIAGALASWTEGLPGAWSNRRTDPVATSGDTRPPDRNVLLTACVEGEKPGEFFPRALANARVRDLDGNVFTSGQVVVVDRWERLDDRALQKVNVLNNPQGCKRKASETP